MLTHHRMSVSIDNGPRVPAHVTITRDVEVIHTLGEATKPNPAWEFVDAAGHFHAYSGADLPTCDPVRIEHPCSCDDHDEDCEGWTETTYVCAICREPVEPGRVLDSAEIVIQRPAEFRIAAGVFIERDPVSVRVFRDDELTTFGVAAIVAQELSSKGARTELILTRVGERVTTTTPRPTGQPAEDRALLAGDGG